MKAELVPLAMANELDALANEFHLACASKLFKGSETFIGFGRTRYHGPFEESCNTRE